MIWFLPRFTSNLSLTFYNTTLIILNYLQFQRKYFSVLHFHDFVHAISSLKHSIYHFVCVLRVQCELIKTLIRKLMNQGKNE